ncbi:MAG: hypothetical protein H5T76_23385, partial [Streptomyces sp.]|nr:hypothetical protein [Streptomyces sp.]
VQICQPDTADREAVCYTLTSTGATVHPGWARHDDSLPNTPQTPNGIAFFDALGNPLDPTADGFTLVPCGQTSNDPVTLYESAVRDVAGGAPYTIVPGTDLVSWNVRNRNATTATIQVNGGPVLPLDTAETIGTDLTGSDRNDVIQDTVIVVPGDGAVRVMEVRRLP